MFAYGPSLEFRVSLETALEEEAMAQALVTQSEDTREGMMAFAERRAPQFKGR